MSLGIKGEITSQPHEYGDAFFGPVNIGKQAKEIDVMNQIAVPVAVSLVSGLLLYALMPGRRRKKR